MHYFWKMMAVFSVVIAGMGLAAAQRPNPCDSFYDPITGNHPDMCTPAVPEGTTVRTANFIMKAVRLSNTPIEPQQFAWSLSVTCPPEIQIGAQIILPGSDTPIDLVSGQTITAETAQFPTLCIRNTGASITLTQPDGQPHEALTSQREDDMLFATLPPAAILMPGIWTLQVNEFQLRVDIPETLSPAIRIIWNADGEVDEVWLIGFEPGERIVVDTLNPRQVTETQANERGMLVIAGQLPYIVVGEDSGSIRLIRDESEIDTTTQEYTEAGQVPLGHMGYLMPTNGPGPYLLNAPYPDMLPNMVWGTPVELPSCSIQLPSRLVVGEPARVSSNVETQTLYRTAGNRITDLAEAIPGELFIPIYGPLCFEEEAWWLIEIRDLAIWIVEGQGDTYYLEPIQG
jgi:hypothetical protein